MFYCLADLLGLEQFFFFENCDQNIEQLQLYSSEGDVSIYLSLPVGSNFVIFFPPPLDSSSILLNCLNDSTLYTLAKITPDVRPLGRSSAKHT